MRWHCMTLTDGTDVLQTNWLTVPAHLGCALQQLSNLEACKLCARCARAVSQIVVERQYRRSVSCIVIAWAGCLVTCGVSGHCLVTGGVSGHCLVTGGASGHNSVTCSSLVLFYFFINSYSIERDQRTTSYSITCSSLVLFLYHK